MKNILLFLSITFAVINLQGNTSNLAEEYLAELDAKFNVGNLLRDQFKAEEAIDYFESKIERNTPTSTSEKVYLHNKLAKSFNDAYLFKKSISLLENIQITADNRIDSILYFDSKVIIGNAYIKTKKLDNALEELNEALVGRIKLFTENSLQVAEIYNLLGQLYYYHFNQIEIAYDYYNKSLSTRIKFPNVSRFDLSISYYNISICNIRLEDYLMAQAYAQKCLSIIEEGSFRHESFYLKVKNLITTCHYYLKDFKTAISLGEEMVQDYLNLNNPDTFNLIINYQNLAEYYFLDSNYEKTNQIISILDNILSKQDSTIYIEKWIDLIALKAKSHFILNSQTTIWETEFDQAEKLISNFYGEFNSKRYFIISTFLEFIYYSENYKKALKYANKLDSLFQNDLNLQSTSPQLKSIIDGLHIKAMLLSDTNSSRDNIELALNKIVQADSLIQYLKKHERKEIRKIDLIHQYSKVYEKGIELCHYLYQLNSNDKYLNQAFMFMEHTKSASLNDFINEKQGLILRDLPETTKNKLSKINKSLVLLEYKYDKTKEIKYLTELNQLAQEKEQIYQKRKLNNFESSNEYKTELEKEIRLKKNQILIEFFKGEEVYYMLIAEKDNAISFKKVEASKLNSFINPLLNQLYSTSPNFSAKSKSQFINNASNLFNVLFDDLLLTKKNKEIIIIPDGILNLLPFEVLLTERKISNGIEYKNLPYWIKTNDISYAFSMKSFTDNSFENQKTKIDNTIIFGYDEKQELENANEEIVDLKKHKTLNASLHINASKQDYFTYSPNANIIHFAIHTRINEEFKYGNCMLLAPDSSGNESYKLFDYEILNQPLKADLVVLNACETNYGLIASGEGVFNLARSFKFAGAKNIVSNLWKVNDGSAHQLNQYFYNNYLQNKNARTSLAKAKRAYLKNSNQYSAHPYYWAGSIVQGSALKEKIGIRRIYLFLLAVLSVLLTIVGYKTVLKKESKLL